jgi:hypothetical protein
LKLQRLQNRLLRAVGCLDRRTLVHEMYVAFKIPYVHDYITKLYRAQAELILNHRNPIVHGIGQRKTKHMKCEKLKFGGGQAYGRSAD